MREFIERLGVKPSPFLALFLAFGLSASAITTALILEFFGYRPCPLCLEQRLPYYLGIPFIALLNLLAFIGVRRKRPATSLITYSLIGLFSFSAYLGAFHAGVEWEFWDGPASCGMITLPSNPNVNALLDQIRNTDFVSCTVPSLRIFGLSLAGLNSLVSLVVVGLLVSYERRSR